MRCPGRLLAPWLLVAGCASEARQEFDVGVHRVSVATHPGWQHVDQGRRHLLRHEEVQLVIEDLGPAGREGIRHEIERARALWHRGQDREARTLMAMVPIAPEHFVTPAQGHAFWNTWHEVSGAPENLDAAEAEARFDRLLDAVATLRDRPAADVIDAALRTMGEDQRRGVASRRQERLDGLELVVIETWNRLSHEDRRRFAILIDAGYTLALRTDRGPWPAAAPAFESTLRSLRIARPAQSAGGERRSST
jgi:hypothetical protein